MPKPRKVRFNITIEHTARECYFNDNRAIVRSFAVGMYRSEEEAIEAVRSAYPGDEILSITAERNEQTALR